MATLRTVTKNTLLYTFSTVLQRASSIIFFPIFSFYLTKGDYGILSVVGIITQFTTVLCGLELGRTATRFIHEGDNVEERAKKIYGTYILTMFGLNIVVGTLLLTVGPWLLKPFLNDIPFYPYIVLTVCTLPFVAAYSMFKNYMQATHQGLRFVKVDFLYFVSNVGFNLLFVIVFGMRAEGLILSTVISSIVFTIYAYFTFFRHTRLRFDKRILTEGLRFSLPLVPFILIGLLQDGTDKILLNAMIGKDAGGILYISTMMAAFFTVLRESANQAIVPWFYQQYGKLPRDYMNRVIYTVFAGMAILALFITWFSYEILAVLSSNKDLVQAYRYTPIIINAALVTFLGQIFNMVVMWYKKNVRYLFLTTLVGWPVNVALCLLLIDSYGIYGAAVSNFLAAVAMTIVGGVLSHRSGFRMNYWYFLLVIVLCMGLSLVALIPLGFWPLLGIKSALALLLSVVFYLYLAKRFPINAMIAERLNPIAAMIQRVRE